MKKAILATKVGMTQIFNEDGVLTPVTVLQAGPCVVTQVKTVENDGYAAVQVGFVDAKEKVVAKDKSGKKEIRNRHGVNKALKGHFEKATELPKCTFWLFCTMDSFFILYYTGSHLKNLFILLFYRNAGFRQHSGNFPGKEVVLWRLCPGFTGIAEKRKLTRTLSLLSRLIQERGGFCWQPSVMGSVDCRQERLQADS